MSSTAVGLLAAGCGPTAQEEPEAEAPGLRIGIRYDQPGVGSVDEEGTPTGMSVDVAAYIAWRLGYAPSEITWVEATAANREQLLVDGEADLIVGTYSWSAERAAIVDFAGPTLFAGQDLLVRADETGISGPEDLTGRVVCSVVSSLSLERVQEMYPTGVEFVAKTRYHDCVDALVADEVDAVTTDDFILAGYAGSEEYFGKVRLVGEPFSVEQYMVGLPPDSGELCEEVTAALQAMRDDGSWERFLSRHSAGTGYDPYVYANPPQLVPCGQAPEAPSVAPRPTAEPTPTPTPTG